MTPLREQQQPATLGSRINAALIFGIGLWIISTLLTILIAVIVMQITGKEWTTRTAITCLTWSTILTLVPLCGVLIRLSLKAATRDWNVEDLKLDWMQSFFETQRDREWSIEDQDRAAQEQMRQALGGRSRSTDDTNIEVIAWGILERYTRGESITRDNCTKAGISNQNQWARVMRAFEQLGWRKGKTMVAEGTITQLWTDWQQGTSIDDQGALYVRSQVTKQNRIVI